MFITSQIDAEVVITGVLPTHRSDHRLKVIGRGPVFWTYCHVIPAWAHHSI